MIGACAHMLRLVYNVGGWSSRWHWPNPSHDAYSLCGTRLGSFCSAPEGIELNRRCRGNGCGAMWDRPAPGQPSPYS